MWFEKNEATFLKKLIDEVKQKIIAIQNQIATDLENKDHRLHIENEKLLKEEKRKLDWLNSRLSAYGEKPENNSLKAIDDIIAAIAEHMPRYLVNEIFEYDLYNEIAEKVDEAQADVF